MYHHIIKAILPSPNEKAVLVLQDPFHGLTTYFCASFLQHTKLLL